MNSLDIAILIIVAISALIALGRGLIKEVLSIIGWVLAIIAVIYLMPILTPFAEKYIDNSSAAAVATASGIVILFFIIWIILTSKIIGSIRNSKLSGLDRVLGLFFGIFRAFLLVVLVYILINWMVPKENQAKVMQESKYFNIAGSFAKPIEDLIPESTLAKIRDKTRAVSGVEEEDNEKVEYDEKSKTDIDVLFEMLAQPKVAKKKEPIKVIDNSKANAKIEAAKKKKQEEAPKAKSYNDSERGNLDRLIENAVE